MQYFPEFLEQGFVYVVVSLSQHWPVFGGWLCTGPLNDWTTLAYVSINILEPLWKGVLGGNNARAEALESREETCTNQRDQGEWSCC